MRGYGWSLRVHHTQEAQIGCTFRKDNDEACLESEESGQKSLPVPVPFGHFDVQVLVVTQHLRNLSREREKEGGGGGRRMVERESG
jgi:hypothetical protein